MTKDKKKNSVFLDEFLMHYLKFFSKMDEKGKKHIVDKLLKLADVHKDWLEDKFDIDINNDYKAVIDKIIETIRFFAGERIWPSGAEFDIDGNKIYERFSNGVEEYYSYDSNGNLLHLRHVAGDESGEEWYEYNADGKLIHKLSGEYDEEWYKRKHKRSFRKMPTKDKNLWVWEEWHEYDEMGNEIHYYDSDHDIETSKYDSKGNLIYYKNYLGREEWKEYDDNGKLILEKDKKGYKHYYEYDAMGKLILEKGVKKKKTWLEYKYDSRGNRIYERIDDSETWYEYDDNNNQIHMINSY